MNFRIDHDELFNQTMARASRAGIAGAWIEEISRGMRGGLWSSFSVPAAGILTSVEPY